MRMAATFWNIMKPITVSRALGKPKAVNIAGSVMHVWKSAHIKKRFNDTTKTVRHLGGINIHIRNPFASAR